MTIYTIYTDAACNSQRQVMVVAYMIRTRNHFITHGTQIFGGKDSTRAETIAVGIAIQNLLNNVALTKKDIVEIHTDSKYTVDYLHEKIPFVNCSEMQETQKRYKKLKERCRVVLVKTASHALEINGNNTVDRLARYKLRAIINGVI